VTSAEFSTVAVLDEAGETVRRVAPWVGALWLFSLPLRLLQVQFFVETARLDRQASYHGDYLDGLALAALAAFLPACYGRAVFVRACTLALHSRRAPGPETWRTPAAGLASYLYTALLTELLFFALLVTVIGVPVCILFAGLAAATAPRITRVGVVQPVREILRTSYHVGTYLGVVSIAGLALLLAWINLYFASLLGCRLGEALGADPLPCTRILRPAAWFGVVQMPWPAETLPKLLFLVGAILLVEPFWLAALVGCVMRSTYRETGEDLRQWFHKLRQEGSA